MNVYDLIWNLLIFCLCRERNDTFYDETDIKAEYLKDVRLCFMNYDANDDWARATKGLKLSRMKIEGCCLFIQ